MTTRDNEPLSALTHLVGAVFAIVGLVLLIVHGVRVGTTIHVVTFTIFGVSMFLLYLMSTLYHFVCKVLSPRARRVLQILDHSAVYFLIAGTYTPVTLIVLSPGWAWSLFGVIWGLTLIGTLIKTLQLPFPPWMSVLLYILMGWLIVIASVPLAHTLYGAAIFWLVLGGMFYTIGAVFFALDRVVPRTRWFGMHEIFHVFVMLGSFSHFWLLYHYLAYVH